MKFQYKFEKILDLREREKDLQLIAYENAVRHFEAVARQLYLLLKKKEDLERKQVRKIREGLAIREIRLQQDFLDNLQKEINELQEKILIARQKMQFEQQKLVQKNIEVKKYEKIKEKEFAKFLEFVNQEDRKFMDELAMQVAARGK